MTGTVASVKPICSVALSTSGTLSSFVIESKSRNR